jgi:hypothetical protein
MNKLGWIGIVIVAILAIAAAIYFIPALCQQRLWFVPAYWQMRKEAIAKTKPGNYYGVYGAPNCREFRIYYDRSLPEQMDAVADSECTGLYGTKCRVLEKTQIPVTP